jgi:GntR family transcriptional regulator
MDLMQSKTTDFELGALPLYAQLARILRTQITSGEYKPDDMLPTEEQLSKAFGVSRITVRGALQVLSREGLIVRYSGKGTFVAKRDGAGASVWAACRMEDLIHGGQETQRKFLARRVLAARRGLAEKLNIPVGAKVIEIERLTHVNGIPLAHVTLIVPHALGREISDSLLGDRTLVQLLLDSFKLQISRVDQWTTASLADAQIAEALGIISGDPLLVIERIFYDGDGRPVELAINRYRTDRFRHHLRLQGEVRAQQARPRVVLEERAIKALQG